MAMRLRTIACTSIYDNIDDNIVPCLEALILESPISPEFSSDFPDPGDPGSLENPGKIAYDASVRHSRFYPRNLVLII